MNITMVLYAIRPLELAKLELAQENGISYI
jgi:hypothetical protein